MWDNSIKQISFISQVSFNALKKNYFGIYKILFITIV